MDTKHFDSDEKSLQHSRAERLKRLRKITGFSRKRFSDLYSISQGTLQNWESARFGGLTEKGARSMISAFRDQQIFCSFEWLMYGFGEEPLIQREAYQDKTPPVSAGKVRRTTVVQEIDFMIQLHEDSVSYYVDDDSMIPLYVKGSYVLGKKRVGRAINTVTNQVCIVQTFDRKKLLRYVKNNYDPQLFDIHALNSSGSRSCSQIGVELVYAAPIIWIRFPV